MAENKFENLSRFALNLNERAAKGKLDPVIGRDEEIRRVLQILSRRTKNNPILVGEPGVGKTAISEGIAQKIVDGDVPENLKSRTIYSLDLGALIAGAKYQPPVWRRRQSPSKGISCRRNLEGCIAEKSQAIAFMPGFILINVFSLRPAVSTSYRKKVCSIKLQS